MASRIRAGDARTRPTTDLDSARKGRFKRYGQLAVPAGADGREVRCACNRCGAHLYAVPGDDGRPAGVCVVCGSTAMTPI